MIREAGVRKFDATPGAPTPSRLLAGGPMFLLVPSSRSNVRSLVLPLLALAALGAAGVGCDDSAEGPAGGPVSKPEALDTHCADVTPVVVDPAACTATPPVGGVEPTPEIHYNSESDDDDCKYHLGFTVTPVRLNHNATFTVIVTALAGDQRPVTGANVQIEGTLDDKFPLPNAGTKTTESAPGVYTIGPVRFDRSGDWHITYHLFETCNDLENSPHGHASFHIDVP